MQTNFTLAQLADPRIADAEKILRTCVHCGFCTATCPTYVTLGDELDSPRGRIYLMKQMFERDEKATEEVATHLDRCLSCLSCMTTCPSGVDYMHLVDHGRAHVAETYERPLMDRVLRRLLAMLIPYPGRFRWAMIGASLAKPLAPLFSGRLRAMLDLAPSSVPSPSYVDRPQQFPVAQTKHRVVLLNGCAQQVLDPEINEATIRLLNRHDCEVVVPQGAGCCGAMTHHMGDVSSSHESARRNIDAWWRVREAGGLDAIIINTSGCGTTVKDYGWMFRGDAAYEEKARVISELAVDISEWMESLELKLSGELPTLRVTYHAACSLQHGQKVTTAPKTLLRKAGFRIAEPKEPHLCCGSAGTYNMLQPEISGQLKARKLRNIAKTRPDVIAAGNIGCMTQITSGAGVPVVHTVSLLDWATGGPVPRALEALDSGVS